MKLKKLASLILAGTLTMSLAACGSTNETAGSPAASPAVSASPAAKTASGLPALTADEIHIGAVFNTELGTEGFSYALGQGFKALEDAGYKVDYAFSIPESAECETAIENLINKGCNVIYATSYGYGEYVANMATKYPNVYFNHYSGSTNATNLATFFPKIEQSEYLCGIIAGKRTKSNQIGYLCSYPIPECVRMVDAFTLGAKSVNPDVTVNVKWTGSWFDPATETATATELVNSGSDVVIAYLDSLNAAIAGAGLGAYSFGYATSGFATIPNSFLASPSCDWQSFFLKDIKRITDGTWTGTNQLFGIEDGLVGLSDMHNLTDGTEVLVNKAIEGFKNGTLDIWAGKISDNKGNVVVEEGKTLDEAALMSLNWFVEGVNGSVS
jgi:basic membrane protein A and related proteins